MEKISRTRFSSSVCVAHFPGSQNIVHRNVKADTADNNRNAVCMTGWLGMSGDLQV